MDFSGPSVSSICIGTTAFIVAFWVTLSPVESDVVDDINWFEISTVKILHLLLYTSTGIYLQILSYYK